jgi:hypothetical protein
MKILALLIAQMFHLLRILAGNVKSDRYIWKCEGEVVVYVV